MTDSESLPPSNILNQETEQALHEAMARFEAMQRAARALVISDQLPTVLQAIADIAAQAVEADLVTLYTFDLVKRKVELIVRGGSHAAQAQAGGETENLSDNASLWALEAWRTGNRTADFPMRSWPGSDGGPTPWTTITAPLIYSERILGILKASNSPERSPFVRSDESLLSSLANIAAMAVESHRLRLEERSQHRQADTLREVARILNYSLDQQRVLELILDQLARVVEYDSASIMLLQGDQITIAAHRKFRIPDQLTIPTQVNAYPHIREVIERRRPVLIEDTNQDPRWQKFPVYNYIGCWLGVPLIGRNQVIGLLNLDKETPHFYSQQDTVLAGAFANQAAIAIENARLYSIERQRVDQLNSLRAIVADISAELELSRLLHSILQRAISLLNTTGGDIGLLDENTREVTILSSQGYDKDYSGVRMARGEGLMGWTALNRRPMIIEDYTEWEGRSPQFSDRRVHAAIGMPFMIGRRVVGVIGLFDQDVQRRFSSADQHILSLLAQHAAIAVENARLYLAARQATERRNILHQVSQDIVSVNLDPEGIYQAIHQAAGRLMPAEAFVITRLLPNGTHFEAVYLLDKSGRSPNAVFPIDHGLTGAILRTGQSVNVPDLGVDNETLTNTVHFGDPDEVQSILAVPMRLRGQVVGMVSAQSYSTDAYNDDDQYLLEMLANYAAIALENHGLFQHVQNLAITDPLTEVFNRRHLFELGERELVRARRFGRSMGVIMIDIDHFKKINDQFGHATGDIVLQTLGRLLKSSVREIDIVGRYGGEELVVVLPEAELPSAHEVAERLRQAIEHCFTGADHLPALTVSLGAACLEDADADFAAVVHRADLAMYQAKAVGGNKVF